MSEKTVRIGAIGISHRGSGMLRLMMRFKGVICPAVCDIYEDRRDDGIEIVKNSEHYSGYQVNGYLDYKEMLEKEELDAVLVCTTWISHARIATDAMKAGLHVGVEVGGAASEEECWQMVRASEENGKFCMLLENCCYGQAEMAIFNMVKKGVFGEIIHLAGGYEHDLSYMACEVENGLERALHNLHRNGDLYPTHGLGPIAKILRINRGNRFLSLTSTASKARGFAAAAAKQNRGGSSPQHVFNMGDVVTTVIRCAQGETITLVHSVSLPRPYSRNCRVQGTKGIWLEDTKGIYIDGISPSYEKIDVAGNPYTVHEWSPVEEFYEKYDHPIWQEFRKNPSGGHGGMDTLTLRAFCEAVSQGIEPPIDVYDCAAWMSITCLSEQSIAMGSMPVPCPDFTNGKWLSRKAAPPSFWNLDEVQ